MKTKMNVEHSGIGFLDMLAVAFIVLKLLGVVTWRWLWVLAPLWGQLVLLMVIVIVWAVVQVVKRRS